MGEKSSRELQHFMDIQKKGIKLNTEQGEKGMKNELNIKGQKSGKKRQEKECQRYQGRK